MFKTIFVSFLLLFCATIIATPPDWSFGVPPLFVMDSYYDYMPGGYNNLPVQIQETGDSGDNGVYIVFHAQPLATDIRNIYLAYIAPGDTAQVWEAGLEDYAGGHAALDIDPDTQDPIFAWHALMNDQYKAVARCDLWHEQELPGNLGEAGIILPPTGVDVNAMWPGVFTGKSPTYDEDGTRRLYVFTRDNSSSPNMLYLGMADYATTSLTDNQPGEFDWSFAVIPQFEEWANDPDVENVNCCETIAADSIVAIAGYLDINIDSEEDLAIPDLFVLWNTNYGEGDWQLSIINSEQVWDSGLDRNTFFFSPMNSGYTSCSIDSAYRLHMPLSFILYGYDANAFELYYYYMYLYMRELVFNPADGTLAIGNLWPQTEDGSPFFPTINGSTMEPQMWPIYWYGSEDAFHENNYKVASNPDNGLMCAVWSDGTKAKQWEDFGDEQYAEWEDTPEIAVTVSSDNGDTWSEPIMLNANETPELAGMTPCYVYPGDRIEYLGEGYARVHLFFYDDNSYGSYIQGNGSNEGGTLRYMALDIYVGDMATPEEPATAPRLTLANHPNPFNPQTTISFSLPQSGKTELAVYNIRGQLVKSLVCESLERGEHSVIWNGLDDNGRAVASGVYFTRLRCGESVQTKKVLLLK